MLFLLKVKVPLEFHLKPPLPDSIPLIVTFELPVTVNTPLSVWGPLPKEDEFIDSVPNVSAYKSDLKNIIRDKKIIRLFLILQFIIFIENLNTTYTIILIDSILNKNVK